jgi:hypothetical protein
MARRQQQDSYCITEIEIVCNSEIVELIGLGFDFSAQV